LRAAVASRNIKEAESSYCLDYLIFDLITLHILTH